MKSQRLLVVALLAPIFWAVAPGLEASEPLRIFAKGDWSPPVRNAQPTGSGSLRARLIIGERRQREDRVETPIYIEIQDASDAIVHRMHLYCDMGPSDFRPETSGGLQCELRDSDGKPVGSRPYTFGGQVPESRWVSLSADCTVRLRASPFGVTRRQAMALTPHLGALWILEHDDAREYKLSGRFVIQVPQGKSHGGEPPAGANLWSGEIVLPPVRIVALSKRKARPAQ